MTTPNICKEQSCSERIRNDHYLCRAHWDASEKGLISKCPQCSKYKETRYSLCIECNEKSKPKMVKESQNSRRYDTGRTSTFGERAAFLEDDPKAEAKRLLFHEQKEKCVYCGHKYKYSELQVDHMIPRKKVGRITCGTIS